MQYVMVIQSIVLLSYLYFERMLQNMTSYVHKSIIIIILNASTIFKIECYVEVENYCNDWDQCI